MTAVRMRPVLALVAALAMVMTLAAGADARPGQGMSFGSRGSRTYSPPAATQTMPGASPIQRSLTQSPAPTATAPMSRPGLFGRGLTGGLLGGFLGAGLLGMLFGYGLFGGFGGFGSLIGLVLQVLVIAWLARLVWGYFQGRRPAYAGASMFRGFMPNLGGLSGGNGAAGPAGAQGAAVRIGPSDYEAFERLLGEIQTAYGHEDLGALRARVTPEMLSYFAEELAANTSRGVVNRVSDVRLLRGDLAEAWREGNVEYASVAMRFSLIDCTVDRASGRVVEGSTTQPTQVSELWTFMRAGHGSWLLSAIQQA